MYMVNRFGFLPVFIFFIYFGITLRSLYFQSISLAPFPVVSMLLSYAFFLKALTDRKSINKDIVSFLSILMIFLSLSLLITLADKDNKLNINSILGINLNILFFLAIYLNRDVFLKYISSLNLVLFVHFSFFFIQLISFHFLGEKIDFLQPITGETQRVNGFSSLEANGFSMFRPSGLFNEPGNYAVHVLTIMWLLKVNDKINHVFEKLLLLSIILSFSLSGMLGVFAYLLITYNYLKISIRKLIISSVIFLGLLFYFYDLIFLYITERVGNIGADNSANVRLSAFDAIFDFSEFNQLFGLGFANDKIDIHLPTIPYFLVTFGFVGFVFACVIFSYVLYKSNVNRKTYLFFLAISFQFYTIMHPLFWLFLTLIIISFKNKGEVNYYVQ
ncbi:TPA: hypothetical protein ACY4P7_000939 [Vibrio parahaemolyticus]